MHAVNEKSTVELLLFLTLELISRYAQLSQARRNLTEPRNSLPPDFSIAFHIFCLVSGLRVNLSYWLLHQTAQRPKQWLLTLAT
jgi:hypothetical protein